MVGHSFGIWSRSLQPADPGRLNLDHRLRQLIHGAGGASPCRQARYATWEMADDAARTRTSECRENVAVVAFANKLARISWAVLRRGETFTDKEAILTV